MMGNEIYLYITVFDQQMIARVPAKISAKTGTDVLIGVEAENMHLFDLDTQRRIGN